MYFIVKHRLKLWRKLFQYIMNIVCTWCLLIKFIANTIDVGKWFGPSFFFSSFAALGVMLSVDLSLPKAFTAATLFENGNFCPYINLMANFSKWEFITFFLCVCVLVEKKYDAIQCCIKYLDTILMSSS